jgi:hypothetical protein
MKEVSRIVVLDRENQPWIESWFTEVLFEISLWSFPLESKVGWNGMTVI